MSVFLCSHCFFTSETDLGLPSTTNPPVNLIMKRSVASVLTNKHVRLAPLQDHILLSVEWLVIGAF